jgi:hypothetical protein
VCLPTSNFFIFAQKFKKCVKVCGQHFKVFGSTQA